MSRPKLPIADLDFIRARVHRPIPIRAERVATLLAERDALYTLYEDVARWREGGGDDRDLRYILDTMDVLEAHYATGAGPEQALIGAAAVALALKDMADRAERNQAAAHRFQMDAAMLAFLIEQAHAAAARGTSPGDALYALYDAMLMVAVKNPGMGLLTAARAYRAAVRAVDGIADAEQVLLAAIDAMEASYADEG